VLFQSPWGSATGIIKKLIYNNLLYNNLLLAESIRSPEIMQNYRTAYNSFQAATQVIKKVPGLLNSEDIDNAGKHFPLVRKLSCHLRE
jgi:hypothetical protein